MSFSKNLHPSPTRGSALITAAAFGSALLCVLAAPRSAQASDRHFNHSYESAVLNPGSVELEPWTTWRAGREAYFSRFDQRLEFEFGVAKNLQTALYWNFEAVTKDVDIPDATGMGTVRAREAEFAFAGISSEWKYKLSDPVADALGTALYGEVSIGPSAMELEAKFILDKRQGNLLFAVNPVAEYEWDMGGTETEKELKLGVSAGVGYFLSERVFLGGELVQTNKFEEGDLEHSRLSAGPSVSAASDRYWVSLSVLPQLVAFKGASSGSHLDLSDGEYVQTRVLMGFDL